MQKIIIGALVGGILLFIWQFLSWSILNIHGTQNQYTANQNEIMEFLDGRLSEGEYFIPTVPPGSSSEDREALYAQSQGKPWAKISYRQALEMSMGSNMFRGFVVDFLAVLLLCFILIKIENNNFMTSFLSALSVGIISYLTIPYLNSIWFEGNSIPELIDAVAQWAICGAWLGWWFNR